ncbi:MAG TPA: dephospho-CoA kinase [Candidatus Polarisedimenticolia bacterium]|jgi:dephospho-CoA kinase|nr:dephospho-CoA kinase [Candidatus Polarisedimenticolia bacterium]
MSGPGETPADQRPFVLRVGLTGGIASGKDTVARHFADWGARVIDADLLARQMVEPGAAGYEEVAREFGRGVLQQDGRIDRKALGRVVFRDPEKRARLEAILHPLIFQAEETGIRQLEEEGEGGIAVVNAALLFEAGTYKRYHRLVVAHCDEAIQIERVMRRDGLGREDAEARVRSQSPTRDKLRVAHYAIDTGDGFEATATRAREVFEALEHDREALASEPYPPGP